MHISKCKLIALSAFLSILFSGFTKTKVRKYVEVTDKLTIDIDKQLTSPLIQANYTQTSIGQQFNQATPAATAT